MIKTTMPIEGNTRIIEIIEEAFNNQLFIDITIHHEKYRAIPTKKTVLINEADEFICEFEFMEA